MNYEGYRDVSGTLTSLPSLSSFDGGYNALIASCFSTSFLLGLLQLLGIRLLEILLLLVLALMLLLLH